MNNLSRSLNNSQEEHKMALERVAVAEAQLQQALQDSQEQVSNCSHTGGETDFYFCYHSCDNIPPDSPPIFAIFACYSFT